LCGLAQNQKSSFLKRILVFGYLTPPTSSGVLAFCRSSTSLGLRLLAQDGPAVGRQSAAALLRAKIYRFGGGYLFPSAAAYSSTPHRKPLCGLAQNQKILLSETDIGF
jgi:hypothetical protein